MFIKNINKKVIFRYGLKKESISFFLFSSLTVIFALLCKNSINDNIISILLIFFVIIFGLPHGALDTLVAKHYKIYSNRKQFFMFYFLYIVCACTVFIGWNYFSIFSLYIFLLISGIHFSADWKNTGLNKAEEFTLGFSLLNFPIIFHQKEVKIIYEFITNKESFYGLVELQLIVAYINLLLMIILLLRRFVDKNILIQVLSIFIFSYILTPILFFITYFCFFHSIKNYNESLNLLKKHQKSKVRSVIIFNTIITCLIGIFIFMFFFKEFSFKNINTIIFVGLAALTVPHMLLRIIIKYKA